MPPERDLEHVTAFSAAVAALAAVAGVVLSMCTAKDVSEKLADFSYTLQLLTRPVVQIVDYKYEKSAGNVSCTDNAEQLVLEIKNSSVAPIIITAVRAFAFIGPLNVSTWKREKGQYGVILAPGEEIDLGNLALPKKALDAVFAGENQKKQVDKFFDIRLEADFSDAIGQKEFTQVGQVSLRYNCENPNDKKISRRQEPLLFHGDEKGVKAPASKEPSNLFDN